MDILGGKWSNSSTSLTILYLLFFFSLSLKEYSGKKIKISSQSSTKVTVSAENVPIIL